jgi:pilus assembly protein CpaC
MKFLNYGICALALAATGALTQPAAAQTGATRTTTGPVHAGELEVAVHKSQVVTADRPIARAMIGSAEVADVLPLSDRSIYVLGKQLGTTSLTLYDRQNRVIAVMDVAVGPDVDGLRKQLGELVPGQGIEARLSNGSVLLTGMVNDAGAAARAEQLARGFAGDKVINMLTLGGSQQVMLEVRFAEVTRQAGEQLGLRGVGTSRDGTFGVVLGSGAGYTPGTSSTTTTTTGGVAVTTTKTSPPGLILGGVADSFGVITKSFSIGSVAIDAALDALEKKGLSRTLAEPTLVALSGEKASFLAGGEFPIPVAQSGTTTNGTSAISVQFKSFGVSLSFTPTVLADKVISLIVEPEVSSLDPSASVQVGGLVIPGLRTRRANTTVELRDGESFAIAGLLSRDFQTTVRQFPLLGSIPLIGALFRSSGFSKGETELLIVVTPHLIAPLKPGQVRLPTDRVGEPRAEDILIDGEGYHPKALPAPSSAGAATSPSTAPAQPAQSKEHGYEY